MSNVLLWRGLVLLLAGYGLLFSFKKTLAASFQLEYWQAFNASGPGFSLGYAALVVLYASATYYALRYAKRQRSGKKEMDLKQS